MLELRKLAPGDEAAFEKSLAFAERNFAHYHEPGMQFESYLRSLDKKNTASRRVIEKCGGIYESSYSGPEVAEPKRRYWIQL